MLCLISFKVNAVHEVNIFMNPSRKKKKKRQTESEETENIFMWYLIIELKISNGLVIKQDKKNTYLNNFFSKVKVLAQLKHPNIVSYQESFEGKGCPVYIIKHIQTHICCSSFMNKK